MKVQYSNCSMSDDPIAILEEIQRLEKAREVILGELDQRIKTLRSDFAERWGAPLPPTTGSKIVIKPGKRGPDRAPRILTPEVRKIRAAALVKAREALAEKRHGGVTRPR